MVLSMFSYRLSIHEEETNDLREHLNYNFLKNQNPLERAMLFIMMGYCYEDIYITKEEG